MSLTARWTDIAIVAICGKMQKLTLAILLLLTLTTDVSWYYKFGSSHFVLVVVWQASPSPLGVKDVAGIYLCYNWCTMIRLQACLWSFHYCHTIASLLTPNCNRSIKMHLRHIPCPFPYIMDHSFSIVNHFEDSVHVLKTLVHQLLNYISWQWQIESCQVCCISWHPL